MLPFGETKERGRRTSLLFLTTVCESRIIKKKKSLINKKPHVNNPQSLSLL